MHRLLFSWGEGPACSSWGLGSHPGPWVNRTVKDTESVPLTDMQLLGCSQFCFQGLLTRPRPVPMVFPGSSPYYPPCCRSSGCFRMKSIVGDSSRRAPCPAHCATSSVTFAGTMVHQAHYMSNSDVPSQRGPWSCRTAERQDLWLRVQLRQPPGSNPNSNYGLLKDSGLSPLPNPWGCNSPALRGWNGC